MVHKPLFNYIDSKKDIIRKFNYDDVFESHPIDRQLQNPKQVLSNSLQPQFDPKSSIFTDRSTKVISIVEPSRLKSVKSSTRNKRKQVICTLNGVTSSDKRKKPN